MTALLAVASWSLQFALIVSAVAATLAFARVRSPRIRLAAWQAALTAGAAAPLLSAVLLPSATSLLVGGLEAAAAAAPGAAVPGTSSADPAVALGIVALGVVARAAWVGAGLSRLRRWAALPPARSGIFDDAACELGVRARLVCADVPSPFTFGWRAPVVVAGERVLSDVRLARAAFLHELTHVARRDWAFTLAEEAVRALLWFHPATWWATAEARLAREELVDRVAAARLGSRRAYLEALLAADDPGRAGWRAVPALVHRHQLARRVRALAVEVPMSARHAALSVVAVVVILVGAAYASASAFPMWTAPASVAVTPEDDVEKPVPTRKVQAVYPAEAKEKKIQGEVALDVTIGTDGLVKDAKVVKSIPELDDAALTAIRQWEFRPGRKNGKAVEVLTTITFSFRLK